MRRHRHHLAPDLRARVDVGAMREQHLDDVGMLLRDGPHQRRLAACRVHVHVGAFVRAAARRPRRCPTREATISGVSPARSARLGLAPACSSRRDHRGAAVQAGRPQRRGAEIVRGVHVGAGANQQIGALEIVAIAGPVQRRRAVGFGGVDVGTLLSSAARPRGRRSSPRRSSGGRAAPTRRERHASSGDHDRDTRSRLCLRFRISSATQLHSSDRREACRSAACRCCRRSARPARPSCPSASPAGWPSTACR